MFGLIFGTACLAGLFYVLRGRHCWGHHRHGGSWRGRMRWLFERLETSPGQERVLVESADAVMEALAKLRDEVGPTRAALGRSLRGEHFDASPLKELNARHDALLEEVRKAVQASLAKVHEALDARQRRELADLLEHGWRRGHRHRGCGWRGAYPAY